MEWMLVPARRMAINVARAKIPLAIARPHQTTSPTDPKRAGAEPATPVANRSRSQPARLGRHGDELGESVSLMPGAWQFIRATSPDVKTPRADAGGRPVPRS